VFAYQDTQGPVEIAFTDRHGGVSGGPFASLDLAAASPDRDPERAAAVARNLALVTDAVTAGRPLRRLALMHQVHGADVHVVDGTTVDQPEAPVADALVTALPGVLLAVRVADCVPVLLADAEAGVVAAVHAGRPGLAAGVVPAAVAAMRDLGATDVAAWVGPRVCGGCYEVPDQLRADVAAVVPASFAETTWGTPALDLGAGVRAQLAEASVRLVHESGRCTREDEDLYSYRRQGEESGRLAGLVWRSA
jgi:purine-nucleoside/S-methyl-5'-thioadenosine phosphorylase / adenosine deaminase